MTNDDRKAFARTLAAMAAAYDVEVDEAVAEGYWMTLEDLPLNLVQAAVQALMRTNKHRPKASEIREMVQREQAAAKKASAREQQIERSYTTGIATRIVRQMRSAGVADDVAIRERLATESERLGVPLYWPGEEP